MKQVSCRTAGGGGRNRNSCPAVPLECCGHPCCVCCLIQRICCLLHDRKWFISAFWRVQQIMRDWFSGVWKLKNSWKFCKGEIRNYLLASKSWWYRKYKQYYYGGLKRAMKNCTWASVHKIRVPTDFHCSDFLQLHWPAVEICCSALKDGVGGGLFGF